MLNAALELIELFLGAKRVLNERSCQVINIVQNCSLAPPKTACGGGSYRPLSGRQEVTSEVCLLWKRRVLKSPCLFHWLCVVHQTLTLVCLGYVLVHANQLNKKYLGSAIS